MARWNAKGRQMNYNVDDRVKFTYRAFSLISGEYVGDITEGATITRVWTNGRYVTLVTDTGKTFTRDKDSASLSAFRSA